MGHGPGLDLVVVGGGIAGLTTAALAQRLGMRVALFEAHTKLGGCAGYFSRGPYTFDAGATALMGLEDGEPIGGLLRILGLRLESERTSAYRVHLPDRTLDVVPDEGAFDAAMRECFPGRTGAHRMFWRWQSAVGETLFRASADVPRLPMRSLGDAIHDLRILGVRGLLAGMTSALTVEHVLRLLRLNDDVPFRSLIAMLLQDTAQAGPESVPFANASACLQAYRRGMSRPRGGMRALAEGLGRSLASRGGDLRTATLVDRVEADGTGGFIVETRRRQRFPTRQVAFNLPLDLACRLLGRHLDGRLGRSERRSRAEWSAFTSYLAIDRRAVPDDTPLFHQVLQSYDRPIHDANNVLISLSPLDDPGYCPPSARVATMSTHTRPGEWSDLDRDGHAAKKSEYRRRMLDALDRVFPDASNRLLHEEYGTPGSFARYTRRALGAVGGPPARCSNTNFLAVDSDVLGSGLWIVGDSVFPGQGTMAVVLSAIRVVERMTGMSWRLLRKEGLGRHEGDSSI